MNFIKTFEARVADAFGTAPMGYTAPFSFKKLAKQAAREMEAETFVVGGVDTAPGLITILVSPADDAAMRLLYPQLTTEVVSFAEAQAAAKGYVFVAEPLARFMVDPSLKPGKFAVFAENVDYETLERLREEERAFLSSASAVGGAAAMAGSVVTPQQHRGAAVMAAVSPSPVVAPVVDSVDDGFNVIPADFPAAEPVPPTQMRVPPQEAPEPEPVGPSVSSSASCELIDKKSGNIFHGAAPSVVIGRERAVCNIALPDPNVSRRHAELSFDGHLWRIRDLGSTNGTQVNDMDITQCALHEGDVITLGLTNLEFRENA